MSTVSDTFLMRAVANGKWGNIGFSVKAQLPKKSSFLWKVGRAAIFEGSKVK